MNILKKIKIGGKIYKIKQTNNLANGLGYSGEIIYNDLVINIRPCSNGEMKHTLLHEMFHGIFEHLGYNEHDEKLIDGLANALYMIIEDNPKMFEKEGNK